MKNNLLNNQLEPIYYKKSSLLQNDCLTTSSPKIVHRERKKKINIVINSLDSFLAPLRIQKTKAIIQFRDENLIYYIFCCFLF